MKLVYKIIILFIFSCTFYSCSTVKYFTPVNQEYNTENIANFYISSTNLIVNDLRGDNTDQTKDVIERLMLSSYNIFNNNYKEDNIIITIDIIEHRAFFTFMTWNAETILNLNISNENNVLKNIVINGKHSKFNIRGYATAEEVSQRAFDNAIKDLLDILTY